jgi:hypothetical protein
MSYIEEIRVGDVGTVIRVTVKDVDATGSSSILDVSGDTVKIILGKPDGSSLERVASFVTDGTDGLVQYVTQAGEIDMQGTWSLQVQVSNLTGSWKSSVGNFKVYSNI